MAINTEKVKKELNKKIKELHMKKTELLNQESEIKGQLEVIQYELANTTAELKQNYQQLEDIDNYIENCNRIELNNKISQWLVGDKDYDYLWTRAPHDLNIFANVTLNAVVTNKNFTSHDNDFNILQTLQEYGYTELRATAHEIKGGYGACHLKIILLK